MLSGRPMGGFPLRKKKPPPWERPGPKLDPFSKLPVDMIQYISNFLSVRDVLAWRRVCKLWKDSLQNPAMSAFWRRASKHAGLPDYCVQRLLPDCDTVDELFHRTRRYTDHVARIHPVIKTLRGIHPFESTTNCLYAGNGYFVKTVDSQSLENEELAVGELCPYRRTIQKVASITGKYGEVSDALLFANNIVWQTSEGYWFRYSLEDESCSRLFERLIKRQRGDVVGYCRHCLFMIIANSESVMHSYNWKLRLFKIEGDSVIESAHTLPIPSKITQYIPRPVKPHLVSSDGCKTHRLIVQGGTGACVFDVTHNSEEKKIELFSKPITILNPFYDSNIPVMVVTTTSEMVLSRDESFVGLLTSMVYPDPSGLCLHFFDLKTYQRSLSVRIKWADGFTNCQLLAVSKLYAVVGIGHSNGLVKIVHCRSGNVVHSISPLSKGLPPVIPAANLQAVHLQGVYGEECLVNIVGKFSIVAMFRKGVGNIEAVFYDPFPPSLALLENKADSESDNETVG